MTRLRVLVVEDDAIIAMLLADVLADMGYEVCATAANEADAVAAALRFQPDLMIVDARLRDGSGIAAVEEILRSGFVPHVFVSGHPLRDQAISPRAVLLQKPFAESDLVRAISRAIAAAA